MGKKIGRTIVPPSITLAVVANSINDMRADICSLVETVNKSIEKDSTFKIEYERRHAILEKEIDANTKDISDLSRLVSNQATEMKDMKDSIEKLWKTVDAQKRVVDQVTGWAYKIFWALFIPFILFVVSFIAGLITHRISIISSP